MQFEKVLQENSKKIKNLLKGNISCIFRINILQFKKSLQEYENKILKSLHKNTIKIFKL